ncbi:putative retrotransposon hot spot protein (RHS,) [Trypanosoma cruzi]|uniref:Putative retrotransposon hot spot protein (RHS,) n=1 Tax=Trypanosoma cruzi TaxID=5693 RepID=A0A2V2UID3_TRYCR|nr:putative retrotransposon hot spot protein (RHS,) [Trypanosoma cruzi]
MPPKRNRVQGGNARSRASAVPQGDRQRRARPESEGETDQPAATHIRVEEARQPQWTMNSTVRDILLERNTLSYNMKLNDFLRNYVGGRAAVGEDHNVTMQVFVQEPDDYVQDQRLLEEILNLTEYQEMEAIYKLHHEGVYSLEQWRGFKSKNTVSPLARGKLKAALTQIQTEERLRRAQEMKFTMSTNIEDVLFKGEFCYKDMNLNDFLTLEMEGGGVVDANWNVLLRDFFIYPSRYISDVFLLLDIKASDHYKRMERAVRDEMDMEEDVRRLYEKGVDNLLKWSLATAEVKANVHNLTKHFLMQPSLN